MDHITLQISAVRQVTYQGAGMHMFQPAAARKLTEKEQQVKDDAFWKRIADAKRHLAGESA